MKRVNTEQERLNNPENPKIGAIGVQTIFTAILALAITFTLSCSGSDDPGNDPNNPNGGVGVPFNENSQVYNEDGTKYTGSGDIKIETCDKNHDNCIYIDAGKIEGGIVKLELTQAIPNKYLSKYISNIHEDDYATRCTDYPEDIEVFDIGNDSRGSFVLTDNNGKLIGELAFVYVSDEFFTTWEGIMEGINYLYSTKAGKITCNYKQSYEGSLASTINVNIDAKAGWNKEYYHYDWDSRYSGGVSKAELSTNNILTKELKWLLWSENED
jgi:hypothetical protein